MKYSVTGVTCILLVFLCCMHYVHGDLEDYCDPPDTICNGTYQHCILNKCSCDSGFESNGTQCVKNKEYGKRGGNCNVDNNCTGSHQQCTWGHCMCKYGYLPKGPNCVYDPGYGKYGGYCRVNQDCAEAHQHCVTTSDKTSPHCSCIDGYIWNATECVRDPDSGKLGGYCTSNNQCRGSNQKCSLKHKCQCKAGYEAGINGSNNNNVKCVRKSDYGDYCSVNEDCSGADLVCYGSKCSCSLGYMWIHIACIPKPEFGQLGFGCGDITDCVGDNQICSNNVCACQEAYVQKGNGCVFRTDSCVTSSDCSGLFQQCLDSSCICQDGFTLTDDVCQVPSFIAPTSAPKQGRPPASMIAVIVVVPIVSCALLISLLLYISNKK